MPLFYVQINSPCLTLASYRKNYSMNINIKYDQVQAKCRSTVVILYPPFFKINLKNFFSSFTKYESSKFHVPNCCLCSFLWHVRHVISCQLEVLFFVLIITTLAINNTINETSNYNQFIHINISFYVRTA